ncbi:hypothetical protein F511_43281 [Dorcoceras hygrometricum]|uniref:Uncharacterized protein n=1 Tax=Dorcoceras hygrometricum TaxID=472368 RepID=A0A2Z7BQ78_9LAMI|nr:hypothetical protein F511_43281 [Dorcoceras hygrometricum]
MFLVDWAVKMRIRPPEFETSIYDAKYHVSLNRNEEISSSRLATAPPRMAAPHLQRLAHESARRLRAGRAWRATKRRFPRLDRARWKRTGRAKLRWRSAAARCVAAMVAETLRALAARWPCARRARRGRFIASLGAAPAETLHAGWALVARGGRTSLLEWAALGAAVVARWCTAAAVSFSCGGAAAVAGRRSGESPAMS